MLDNIFKDYNISEKLETTNFIYYKVIINYNIYFVKTINNTKENNKKLLENEINKYNTLANIKNIPKILKYDIERHWYIIYEYIDGISLAKNNSLNYIEKLSALIKICEILEKFHALNIAHCDIKPSNVLIDKTGNLFLIDLGTCTNFNDICYYGSFRYCSVEQLKGKKVNQNFDIYSLGILMYELLVGHNPFSNIKKEEINLYKEKNDNILSTNNKITIPESCQKIIYKAITTSNYKYNNIVEMKKDLIAIFEKIPNTNNFSSTKL